MFLYEKEMKKYTGFTEQSSAAPNIKGKVNESFTHRVSHVERDTQGCVCKGGTTDMATHFHALVWQVKIKIKNKQKQQKGELTQIST